MLKSLFQRLCALSLGLGIACAAQAQPTKVTYLLPAPPNSPAFAPWIIAKEKGYYTASMTANVSPSGYAPATAKRVL